MTWGVSMLAHATSVGSTTRRGSLYVQTKMSTVGSWSGSGRRCVSGTVQAVYV